MHDIMHVEGISVAPSITNSVVDLGVKALAPSGPFLPEWPTLSQCT